MDWGTHVVLAIKVLESCGLNKGAAIYSVIPVIDKEPAHFHRVYAHILENQPDFLDIAMEIFSSDEIKKRDFDRLNKLMAERIVTLRKEIKNIPSEDHNGKRILEKKIYAYKRITDEIPIFMRHAEEAGAIVNDEGVKDITSDKLSAAVSLLSHTYFDTWNNPIQLFLPGCSYCSAQWEFWNNIDYMKFRGDFYKSENITNFRKEIIKSPVWDIRLKPEALIKAFIIRIGEMGQPSIPYEVIDMGIRDFMRYMDINTYQRADTELQFCYDIEREIKDIIYKDYKRY
jgi:hypothetical protein